MLEKRKHVVEDFPHAIDLVAFIKKRYGDYFTVGVAAYPDTHPDSKNVDEDLKYLKQKVIKFFNSIFMIFFFKLNLYCKEWFVSRFFLQVLAGADYILTQATLNGDNLIRFLRKCKEMEINVPIILGFFIYDTYGDLTKRSKLCDIQIPTDVLKFVAKCGDNSKQIRNYSIDSCTKMIKDLYEENHSISGVHFYTFNDMRNVKEFITRYSSYFNKQNRNP